MSKMTTCMSHGASTGLQALGVFDTSAETAYPALLAQRAVQCMLKVVAQSQLSLQALPRLHDLVTAAQDKQSRCHSQLIPEFHPFSKQSQQQGPKPPGSSFRG